MMLTDVCHVLDFNNKTHAMKCIIHANSITKPLTFMICMKNRPTLASASLID